MLVKTYGCAVHGIDAGIVTIEVNVSRGIRFYLVGLPDNAVKESQHRIVSAMSSSKLKWPGKQIVINMAPADLRKEGASYDLPLAIGVLAATKQVNGENLAEFVIMGELSLDGGLRPVKGVLPIALKARDEGFKGIILPADNAKEAAVVEGLEVYPAGSLQEVTDFLNGVRPIEMASVNMEELFSREGNKYELDFADVKGQETVKRALEIAAAGGHHALMIGPPGSGKTMLARRLPGIIPPLSLEEALETTRIHSVAGKMEKDRALVVQRPFRSPHHTISTIALVGGGAWPQPGEISLSNNGVLFLDELPEFKRSVLEVMRQPMEDRTINISRAKYSVDYPASFTLIASMNPCPCGYYNHPFKECVCSVGEVKRYLNRISGPLMDRIDLHIEVVPVDYEKMSDSKPVESSAVIRERVLSARKIQRERFSNDKTVHTNAQMSSKMLRRYCLIGKSGSALLKNAMERLGLSARAYDKILMLGRTIADLEGEENISDRHIAEAIQFRSLDRENWGT